jgi:hypothetical protein
MQTKPTTGQLLFDFLKFYLTRWLERQVVSIELQQKIAQRLLIPESMTYRSRAARFLVFAGLSFLFYFLSAGQGELAAKETLVEPGTRLIFPLSTAVPGDEFVLKQGIYPGGIEIKKLHGTREKPIIIRSEKSDSPAVIIGGFENLKLSSCSWIVIDGIHLTDAYDNGLNIDDVSDAGKTERSHHIVLRNLVVKDSGLDLNSDGIKLSGCDDLLVENCTVSRWSRDGCAIDMMRCQRVLIEGGTFDGCSWGFVGLQAKGGSSNITFRRCRVQGVLHRGIQIGGSSDTTLVWPPDADYEAARIEVKECEIDRGEASIIIINAKSVRIEDCKLIQPRRWFFRLLSESQIPNVIQAGEVTARRNYFLMDRGMVAAIHIKPGIRDDAIQFSENIWYCPDAPQRTTRREVSYIERNGIHGVDPVNRVVRGELNFRSFEQVEEIYRARSNQEFSELFKGIGLFLAFTAVFGGLWLATIRVAIPRWQEAVDRFSSLLQRSMPWLVCLILALVYGAIGWQRAPGTGLGFAYGFTEFGQSHWLPDQEQTGQWLGRWFLYFVVATILGGYAMLGTIPSWLAYLRMAAVAFFLTIITQKIDFCVGSLMDNNRPLLKEHVHAAAWGTLSGVLISWLLFGGIWDRETRNTDAPLAFGPLDLPLVILSIALIRQRLEPLDFEGSLRNIYLKLESLTIALVPDFRFLGSLPQLLLRSGPMVFMGILAAIVATSNARPVRPVRSAAGGLLVFCLLLEAVQAFRVNGYCSTASALVDFAFGLIGIGLAHTVVAWHPWLSPRPDGSALGRRMRWCIGVGLMMVALLAIARF